MILFVGRFFFSSRRRHTRCALVTGVQTCALPIVFPPAYTAPSNFVSIQKSFTQEARVQSADPEAALSWTIGGFYQNSRQHTEQSIVAPLFPDFMLGFGVPVDLFFAPGGMLPNGVLYASNDSAKDTQQIGRASCRERVCQYV